LAITSLGHAWFAWAVWTPPFTHRQRSNPAENMLLNEVNEADVGPIEGVVTRGRACSLGFLAKFAIHGNAIPQNDRPLGSKIDDRPDVESEPCHKIAIGGQAFERLDSLAFPEEVLVLLV
jgi:hypothetical protein